MPASRRSRCSSRPWRRPGPRTRYRRSPLSRPELTEEQLRALEEQMERLEPDDIMLDALVSLINLGARKLRPDVPPGEEAKGRDLAQARQAIDGARALLGQVESRHAAELGQVRDALSRLQMAFVQMS